jgi:hypothetical protein
MYQFRMKIEKQFIQDNVMKFSIFLFLFLFMLRTTAQSNYARPLAFTPTEPSVQSKMPDQHDIQLYSPKTIHKKLRQSRGYIISGAILTGIGGGIFMSGIGYYIWLVRQPLPAAQPGHVEERNDDPTPIILWASASPELTIGIPVLSIGVVQHRKWMNIKEQIDIHAGIMTNNHIGFTMNF